MAVNIGRRNVRERLATFGFFIFMGTGTSAWFSRLPSVKEILGLQPSSLALMTILGGCVVPCFWVRRPGAWAC